MLHLPVGPSVSLLLEFQYSENIPQSIILPLMGFEVIYILTITNAVVNISVPFFSEHTGYTPGMKLPITEYEYIQPPRTFLLAALESSSHYRSLSTLNFSSDFSFNSLLIE